MFEGRVLVLYLVKNYCALTAMALPANVGRFIGVFFSFIWDLP